MTCPGNPCTTAVLRSSALVPPPTLCPAATSAGLVAVARRQGLRMPQKRGLTAFSLLIFRPRLLRRLCAALGGHLRGAPRAVPPRPPRWSSWVHGSTSASTSACISRGERPCAAPPP